MKRTLIYFFFILFAHQFVFAQEVTGKIIDSKTGETIPYANILFNGSKSLISNAEGNFSLTENNNEDDSILEISYLGYVKQTVTLEQLKNQQNIIKMQAGVFELADVNVSNIKPNPYNIMATVKENLERNYKRDDNSSKEVLFYREENSFTPIIMDLKITESTGFTKENLKITNAEISSFNAKMLSHPPKEYKDIFCNYYSKIKTEKDKRVFTSKLDVVKAIQLKDENRSADVDNLQETATKLVLKHLDTTRYYRIKSGLLGSRDSISLRKDFYKRKLNKENKNQASLSKRSLENFMSKNNFLQNSKLDFVNQYELYHFEYEGAIYSNENEFVYVLNFRPKKSKAKYTGKLYISENDYGVVKAEYALAENKNVKGFNMKFLLGIKSSENISKGTIIFNRNTNGVGYHLRYASKQRGVYFYLNRPLKFIELTREKKDVLALDIKIEGNTFNKKEIMSISNIEITNNAFVASDEKNFKFIPIKKYDPKLWKGISTIEPLEEMKQFKTEN
ncbi:CarboxypepD_reg-like domain containing protein [Flavobacteriaceae bacterium]